MYTIIGYAFGDFIRAQANTEKEGKIIAVALAKHTSAAFEVWRDNKRIYTAKPRS
jgi:hypothetical protein